MREVLSKMQHKFNLHFLRQMGFFFVVKSRLFSSFYRARGQSRKFPRLEMTVGLQKRREAIQTAATTNHLNNESTNFNS